MKIFSVILAVFVLFLSAVPCNDEADFDHSASVEHHHDADDHDHDESDGCSPFCFCNCCHTAVIFTLNILNTTSNTSFPEVASTDFYESFSPNGILTSIWRPPKYA